MSYIFIYNDKFKKRSHIVVCFVFGQYYKTIWYDTMMLFISQKIKEEKFIFIAWHISSD